MDRYSGMPSLNPMSTFDPDRLSRVHDLVNGRMLVWHARWASDYRQYARTDKVDGTVWWDGLVFDGWEPATRAQ
jgi:hypothetical protein